MGQTFLFQCMQIDNAPNNDFQTILKIKLNTKENEINLIEYLIIGCKNCKPKNLYQRLSSQESFSFGITSYISENINYSEKIPQNYHFLNLNDEIIRINQPSLSKVKIIILYSFTDTYSMQFAMNTINHLLFYNFSEIKIIGVNLIYHQLLEEFKEESLHSNFEKLIEIFKIKRKERNEFIPNDVLIHIFNYLNHFEWMNLSLVSSNWNVASKSNIIWKV
jgi:predicted nucleic-acid-binding Zn-ribbon protein